MVAKYKLGSGILVSGGVIEPITHVIFSALGYSYRTSSDEIHEADIKDVFLKAQKRTRKKVAKIAGKINETK